LTRLGLPAPMSARAHVLVRGVVQGVSFRALLKQRALARQVAGWVRNRPDGSVEAILEGAEEAVRSVVDWCRRGPAGAVVDSIEAEWEEPRGERGFEIR
jgi:acylphosphatase